MSFSRPSPADTPPALRDPTPTADLRVRRANAAGRLAPRVLPGLDAAALGRRYGGDPANTKQTQVGVFRAPLGASWDEYRRVRDRALQRFLAALEARGYRLIPRKGAIRVDPGLYPARHPDTGACLLDQREFRVSVDCSAPNAEPVLVQLDPEDVAPIVRT